MAVRIVVADGSEAAEGEYNEELASLYRWLTDDPELRLSGVEVSPETGTDDAGHMGPMLDAINIVLSNSISLSGLILSYRAWRDSRPQPPRVRVEADGTRIDLDTDAGNGVTPS